MLFHKGMGLNKRKHLLKETVLCLAVILFIIAPASLSGWMGCGMKKNYEIKKMLSYMKYKYGEEFEYVEGYAGQHGSSYTMILVQNKKEPDKQALVRFSIVEGKKSYEDNYLALRLKSMLEKEVGALAKSAFGECKCFYKLPHFVFPPDFPANMKPGAFLRNPYAMAQFYIYPKKAGQEKAKREEDLERFRELNAKKGYKIRGTVSYPKDAKNYESITAESFVSSDYSGYEAAAEIVFSMDASGNFRYARWLSGEDEKGNAQENGKEKEKSEEKEKQREEQKEERQKGKQREKQKEEKKGKGEDKKRGGSS